MFAAGVALYAEYRRQEWHRAQWVLARSWLPRARLHCSAFGPPPPRLPPLHDSAGHLAAGRVAYWVDRNRSRSVSHCRAMHEHQRAGDVPHQRIRCRGRWRRGPLGDARCVELFAPLAPNINHATRIRGSASAVAILAAWSRCTCDARGDAGGRIVIRATGCPTSGDHRRLHGTVRAPEAAAWPR